MRVFLDVGGHYGETLEVVLDPRLGFHRVFSFEPASSALRILRAYRDPRLQVIGSGLSDQDRHAQLYGAGLLGASVYADKPQYESLPSERVTLLRASEWVKCNTEPQDEIFIKLNCEGSEADVLDDLLSSGVSTRIRSIYVDFDVRKSPSQAHRQAGLEKRLRESGVECVTTDDVGASGSAAVQRWLAPYLSTDRTGSLLRYWLRLHRPPRVWLRTLALRIFPKRFVWAIARRVSRLSR